MSPKKPVSRILEQQPQQPAPDRDLEQQQTGSNEAQSKPGARTGDAKKGQQQMGEGSYEATRDYQQRTDEYLKKADVEADAQAAKPRSAQEAKDLEDAEKEGRSHSKGER